MDALNAYGEWTSYWNQCVVDSPEFDLLGWLECACNCMQLVNKGNVALDALMYPVTASIAEGIFCAKKGLLTSDCRYMS